jgi:phosphate transport system substrate-binding protein
MTAFLCRERLLRRALVLACALALAAALFGCDRGSSTERLTVSGSTTILPNAEIAGEMFEEENAETRVLVSGVGSYAGIESVAQGSSDIGTSSRDLKGEEGDLGLVDTPIAYDAIAVIVNPRNTVRGLTKQQAKDIFQGRITNWREVGGPDLPIGLVNRDEASGTREAFGKIVLDEEPFDPTAAVLPGTGQVRSVVADAEGAVGYISLGFVNDQVKPLAIDGVEPTPATVKNGEYPVRRVLHFLTNGEPKGLAAEYIDFVLSPEIQESVVSDAGFLPIGRGE